MMKATIHRGAHEIGGTLIELNSGNSRLLLDAGYPLFLNGNPIEGDVAKLPHGELLNLGVLPKIDGLYKWDSPSFDGILISHAHLDHYGLLKFIHPDIPVYLSAGTLKLIEVTQIFELFGIVTILLQKEQVTALELAEKFEANRRTIGRESAVLFEVYHGGERVMCEFGLKSPIATVSCVKATVVGRMQPQKSV
jgi:glyoxylase-like metal-dependent hydrolase (beta-lactamase superfamily II)